MHRHCWPFTGSAASSRHSCWGVSLPKEGTMGQLHVSMLLELRHSLCDTCSWLIELSFSSMSVTGV